jgi:hypothetical protein
MDAHAETLDQADVYPVTVHIQAATEERNRLTAAVRFFLAIPHLILVGGPGAIISSVGWNTDGGAGWGFSSGGLLGVIVFFAAVIAWLAIVVTARQPDGIWRLASYYLRWRMRATAYVMLLRDEYPPFGDGDYPADLVLSMPAGSRDRVTVAFRLLLALPHICVLWLLSLVWAFTTAVAWALILITGRYPETLYGFAIGVFAWGVRVEAYLLLLRDEYPPFTLRA